MAPPPPPSIAHRVNPTLIDDGHSTQAGPTAAAIYRRLHQLSFFFFLCFESHLPAAAPTKLFFLESHLPAAASTKLDYRQRVWAFFFFVCLFCLFWRRWSHLSAAGSIKRCLTICDIWKPSVALFIVLSPAAPPNNPIWRPGIGVTFIYYYYYDCRYGF